MRSLFRRFVAAGLAALALAPALAGGASPVSGATVIYVDDNAGNNDGISCPNPVGTIQAGVDAVPATGNATVYVCPGLYTAGAHIVGKPNVKLIAKGFVTIRVPTGYDGFVFLMEGTSNTLITGFHIDGRGELSLTNLAVAIGFFTGSSGSVLKNTISGWRHSDLTQTGPGDAPIEVDHSGVVKIDHNTLYDFTGNGIRIVSSSAPVISHNQLTYTSHSVSPTHGIQLEDVPGGSVTSNNLRSDGSLGGPSAQGAGIRLVNSGNVKVKSNGIIAILIGLLVSSGCEIPQQSDGNQLTANKLTDVAVGIRIIAFDDNTCVASASRNQVVGNTLYFSGLGDLSGTTGIKIEADGTAPVLDRTVLNKNVIAGYETNIELSTGVTNIDQTPPNKTMPSPPPGF